MKNIKTLVYCLGFGFAALHIVTFQALADGGVITQATAENLATPLMMLVLLIVVFAVGDGLNLLLDGKQLSRSSHVFSAGIILAFGVTTYGSVVPIWFGLLAGVLPASAVSLRAEPVRSRIEAYEQRLDGDAA